MKHLLAILLIPTLAGAHQGYPVNSMLAANTYRVGLGTGFKVEYNGQHYLVTNWHVCEDRTSMQVKHASWTKAYPVKVLATFPEHDLCVLKARPIGGLKIGAPAKIGYPVYSAGYPVTSGGKLSFTSGVVSSRETTEIDMRSRICPEPYVTKSAGNATACYATLDEQYSTMNGWYGRSGSPVVNSKGQVVGVVNIKQGKEEEPAKNIAGFIPVEHLVKDLKSLQAE